MATNGIALYVRRILYVLVTYSGIKSINSVFAKLAITGVAINVYLSPNASKLNTSM
jgi:hypothetical protein